MVICDVCGKKFRPVRSDAKSCSSICRFKKWDRNNPRITKEALKEANKAMRNRK